MTSGVELYGYWRSSCSYRVRIGLNLKGIKYDTKPVCLLRGEQLMPEYLSLQPQGLVPALKIDGEVLVQSMAILEYLDEAYPGTPLLPKDPKARASVRAAALMIAADTQPLQNLSVLKRMNSYEAGAGASWAREVITRGLGAAEKVIAKTAGTCGFGDAPTLIDIVLVPQVYNARRFEVDMSAFPTISRVVEHLETLPAFVEAHPSRQPDAATA